MTASGVLAVAVCLSAANLATAQTYTTIQATGPSSNRVDAVFIGDGYTADQLDTLYAGDVQATLDHMFNGMDPFFERYRDYFNVYRVNVASNESGADIPAQGIYRDTALDAAYVGSTTRLTLNASKADAALTNSLLPSAIGAPDIRLAVVNSSKYGASGGSWAVYAGGSSYAGELALHELGHSFAGLADEYYTSGTVYLGPEPTQPNITTTPGKWDPWLGYDDPANDLGAVGYYEGARNYASGIYRPTQNSKMRSLNRPFDAIARESFIQEIYQLVDPLDAWTPNAELLVNPSALSVEAIDQDNIRVCWTLDGQDISNVFADTLDIDALSLAPGLHDISARAMDLAAVAEDDGGLGWVRTGAGIDLLEQTVTWSIQVCNVRGDFNNDLVVDALDVDLLWALRGMSANEVDAMYDLDSSGLIDLADAQELIKNIIGTSMADIDLDHDVDIMDMGILASNYNKTGNHRRGDTDFNGSINVIDLSALAADYGKSFVVVAPLPEPATLCLLTLGGAAILRRRRARQ